MDSPLVSVICLCYNQGQFVKDCVNSILNQSYKNIEIIIVDDASTDNSREIIDQICRNHPQIEKLYLNHSGNCVAFNKGFNISKGDFVVDLAADDLFAKDRIKIQIEYFLTLPKEYGIVHTDAQIIDSKGNKLGEHFKTVSSMHGIKKMPEGYIFHDLIAKYLVSAPTMLVRRAVLEEMKGYDESLEYEDFDFWIRSSFKWSYGYIPKKLTTVRKLPDSMSSNMYERSDNKIESTFKVCKKIEKIDDSLRTLEALHTRVGYEFRMVLKKGNLKWVLKWFKYFVRLKGPIAKLFPKV